MSELLIYGEIGTDVSASDVVSELKSLETDTLTVRVNSPGGDVYEGLAIMNALRAHSATVTAVVEGLAASAASFIAVGGADRVVMRPTAELMIHDAMSFVGGNAAEMGRVVTDLERISNNLASVYATRGGGDPAEWRERMRAETWFSADEAVAAGLADAVEDGRPVAALAASRFSNHFKFQGRRDAPAPAIRKENSMAVIDSFAREMGMSVEALKSALHKVVNEEVTLTSTIDIAYPEGTTVVPTGKVTIEPGNGEPTPPGLLFEVGEVADGFTAEIVAETGALTVTAPSGAEPDTEVVIPVTVTGNDAPVELPVTVTVKSAAGDEEEAAPAGDPATEEPVPADRVVLDMDTYNDLKAAAKLGWDAKNKADTASREAEVDQWIKDGRFNVAIRSKAVALAHKDMDAARALYGSIPKNTIPVKEIGHGQDREATDAATKSDFRARADRLLGTRSNY